MRKLRQEKANFVGLKSTATTGLCAGAIVMTLDGERTVEALVPGDRLITRGGTTTLNAITSRDAVVAPVRIKASSLGHTRPRHDALVTMESYVHIRDWRAQLVYGVPCANVAAGRLVDGEFIAILPQRMMTVYDLSVDADSVIYADGIEMLLKAA